MFKLLIGFPLSEKKYESFSKLFIRIVLEQCINIKTNLFFELKEHVDFLMLNKHDIAVSKQG